MAYCYWTDNKVVCLPPKMADGRVLTDYRSSSLVNAGMQNKSQQVNQYAYRQYLIQNGNRVAAEQTKAFQNSLAVLEANAKKVKKVPERYMTVCQGNKCEIRETNPRGIGIGRMPTSNWMPLSPSYCYKKA